MLGGKGESKPMDNNTKELLNKHKSDVGTKLGMEVKSLEGVSYATQVVAGTNYHIKAKVNGNTQVEVVVYVPLPHTGKPSSLTSAKKL